MRLTVALAVAVLLIPSAVAQKKTAAPAFKTAEAKHFNVAEGVELTAEFTDYLYAELRSELQKTKLFEEIVGDGEVVEQADAAVSLIVEGSVIRFDKGSRVKESLIGLGVGRRSLSCEARVTRRSNGEVLATINKQVRASTKWDEKELARNAAKDLAGEIKKALAKLPPPSA